MRRLWILFASLTLTLLVLLLVLRSEPLVLRLVHWSLETFTELRLDLVNPRIDLLGGHISADEVHLTPLGVDAPALISIIDLEVDTHLREIYKGNLVDTEARAEQVLVYVSESDDSSDPTPVQWLDLTFWVPSAIEVSQTHVILAADSTRITFLRNLKGKRLGKGRFHATADSLLHERRVEITLDSMTHSEDRHISRLELSAELVAPEIDSSLSLDGDFIATEKQAGYDFLLAADYRDIRDFFRAFEEEGALDGRLALNARMQGDIRGFRLSDMSLVVDNMPSYGFEAAGEMMYDGENAIIDMVASGELDSMEYLVDWVDLDLTDLGRAEAGLRISGPLGSPFIEKFIVATSSAEQLDIIVTGQLDLRGPDALSRERNEVFVDAFAPSLSALDRWLGDIQLDPGAWRASGAASGVMGDIHIDNLILETGSHDTYKLRVEGTIGKVGKIKEAGLAAITGVDLTASAHTFDSATLSGLVGRELPGFQEVSAKAHLGGSGEDLALGDAVITIAGSDLRAELDNIQARLQPGQRQKMQDLSAEINVSISDTSALSQYSSREIPVLGPVQIQAKLSQHAQGISLEALQASIDSEVFKLETTGQIKDLVGLSGVMLDIQVSDVDIRHGLLALLQDFQYETSLGELEGKFKLEDRDGKWHIPEVEIKTTTDEGPITYYGKGSMADLGGFTTANIDSRFAIRDPALGEALTGLRIKPGQGTLSVKSTPDRLTLSGRARMGNTRLSSEVTIDHDKQVIEKLDAVVSAPHLYLDDLGLQSNGTGRSDYKPATTLKKLTPTEQLGRVLDSAPDYPLELSVTLGGLSGSKTRVGSVDVHLTSADKRYTLRRFSIAQDDARAELRGSIDLNPNPPELTLAGQAIALPLGSLGEDLGIKANFQGTLTARGGISARGRTGDRLVETLNGSLALALEDTIIRGGAYDVLVTDLLAWLYSGAVLEKSTHVDCAMAQFNFRNGVATSDDLYVETSRMLATGNATFDLVKREMDLTIVPRSRSRSLQIPSRIRLSGDMSDPRPTISPISAAADASAQALLLVPTLALRLFGQGGETSDKGVQPCQAHLGN